MPMMGVTAQIREFEKAVRLKMDDWTEEDWRYFERYCKTGALPDFKSRKRIVGHRVKRRGATGRKTFESYYQEGGE